MGFSFLTETSKLQKFLNSVHARKENSVCSKRLVSYFIQHKGVGQRFISAKTGINPRWVFWNIRSDTLNTESLCNPQWRICSFQDCLSPSFFRRLSKRQQNNMLSFKDPSKQVITFKKKILYSGVTWIS